MDGLLINASEKKSAAALARSFLSEFSTSVEAKWLHERDVILGQVFEASAVAGNESAYHAVNMHLCTYPELTSRHLTTGIVLQNVCTKEYWVVLNCSCDLIPVTKQPTLKWAREIAPGHPFTAVKLVQSKNVGQSLRKANKCRTIFLTQDDKRIALSFPDNENPHYEVFYAADHGIISNEKISARRVSFREGKPGLTTISLNVVAQMRYEYASRFLNILSAHKSRIGVDFLEMK